MESKAAAEKLREDIEGCKAKLRDSKTPPEQMAGKCKRTSKLNDRCEVLEKNVR